MKGVPQPNHLAGNNTKTESNRSVPTKVDKKKWQFMNQQFLIIKHST